VNCIELVEQFEFDLNLDLHRTPIERISNKALLVSAGLGFALSILFFMDQNITGQIVNSPTNNLKKGPAPHLDLLVLGKRLIHNETNIPNLNQSFHLEPEKPL
jgi:hypothetical protein